MYLLIKRPWFLYNVILGESVTLVDPTSHHIRIGNGQHITMFFFFGLSGLIDVLTYYKYPLPPDTDYVTGLLAYTIEGTLFLHHLYGQDNLSVLVSFHITCAVQTRF